MILEHFVMIHTHFPHDHILEFYQQPVYNIAYHIFSQ